MPSGPEPASARSVAAHLDALRALLAEAEEDVLASLVVTGEPRPQRVLDDWLDQVADSLRALTETADEVALALAPYAGAGAPAAGAERDRQVPR
ncbi:hypothetical protein H9L10_02940 [Phycicoccus endophyticus]|uniref:Uncharacterized protein n=1 Tax=Phycicoccus endophyticus TaxID=1690220 RepID=A0A7G9R374_9MICO|nr:hypothetical protein [Phycicoccus endophyticus]NHI19789.1 hypothetical protein [Phycicoccus endophyticus]QNN50049.1 hypothetical protein H9L10_02940 [Phycicoccus endophyticus]GGL28570.1 hypothetical protein GCM10012283_08490 [Phycicoccus endophyticus]